MKKVVVLGGGKVGFLIADELSSMADVTLVDNNPAVGEQIKNSGIGKFQLHDLIKSGFDMNQIPEADLYIGAVPGWMGYRTVEALAAKSKPVVDISFFGEDPAPLHELYKRNNAICVLDAGVAPGLSNFIAGHLAAQSALTHFTCYVGGLPFERKYPHEYVAPFSPIDVIEEYTRPARIVENGQIVIKQPLSEPELLHFDEAGELEAFNSDGLRSLLYTLKIPNMKEKTLRYPKHAEYMRFLQAAGFFDDTEIHVKNTAVNKREATAAILLNGWKGDNTYDEYTVMRLELDQMQNGSGKKIIFDIFDRRDKQTGYSSMARTTGYTCCAAAKLILEEKISSAGLLYPEELAKGDDAIYNEVINYLTGKGISIKKREELV